MSEAQKLRARRYYLKNKEKCVQQAKEWAKAHPERRKEIRTSHRLRAQYRLTPEQYNMLLAAQQGRCGNPGCDETPGPGPNTYWHLDHQHDTVTIRGFLCHGCNVSLGFLKENKARIAGLIQYLESPPAPNLLGG